RRPGVVATSARSGAGSRPCATSARFNTSSDIDGPVATTGKAIIMAKQPAGRRYGPMAAAKVHKAMHERKHGTLRSGRAGRKVTSRKQAIAIGLSEARRAGGKVPRTR